MTDDPIRAIAEKAEQVCVNQHHWHTLCLACTEAACREAVEQVKKGLKSYTGETPCPLCKYGGDQNRVHEKACWFHSEIARLDGQRVHYKGSYEKAEAECDALRARVAELEDILGASQERRDENA